MITNPVIAWLFAIMIQVAPPERLAAQPQIPGHEETAEEKRVRYESIATDLYTTVYDPTVTPLFRGSKGRAMTAVLELAVAFHEGGFAHDVDKGPCYQGKGFRGRCDGGLAACLMQIELGDGTTKEGWSKADLFADRQKCFRAGLSVLRRSMSSCRKLPPQLQLGVYAQGSCTSPVGQRKSRELYGQFRQFVAKADLPGPDESMMPSQLGDGHPLAANER